MLLSCLNQPFPRKAAAGRSAGWSEEWEADWELGFPKAAGGWLSGARPSHGPVPVIILLFITPCAVLDAQ